MLVSRQTTQSLAAGHAGLRTLRFAVLRQRVVLLADLFPGNAAVGRSELAAYLGWFLTAGISASPYVLYRVLGVGLKREMSHNLFPFHLWAQSMTLPFFTMPEMTKSIRLWTVMGFTSVVFGFVFVTFSYLRYWKTDRKELASATMILLFPLWTMWLISFGRDQIAAWYSVHYAFVWTGIIGFAFLLGRSVRYSPLAPSAFYRPRGFEWMSPDRGDGDRAHF